MLDSNDYAHQETDYDFILATDAHTVVQSQSHHAFTALQTHLHSHSDWLFGYLSYDLKNGLENLQSQNLDYLDNQGFVTVGFPNHFLDRRTGSQTTSRNGNEGEFVKL